MSLLFAYRIFSMELSGTHLQANFAALNKKRRKYIVVVKTSKVPLLKIYDIKFFKSRCVIKFIDLPEA